MNTKLTFGEKFAHSLSTVPYSIFYFLFASLMMYFYTDVAGISPSAVGIMFLVARVWDGINDPMFGVLIEKCHFKSGKVRPWLLIGAVTIILFGVGAFISPGFSESGSLAYAYFTYIGLGMTLTILNLAPSLLMTRLTRDQKETMQLNANMTLVASVASIIIGMVTMPLITTLTKNGNVSGGYTKIAVLYALLSAATLLIVYFKVKERTFAEDQNIESAKLLPLLSSVIRNKYFIVLCLAALSIGTCNGIAMSTMPFYAMYNLGSENYMSIFSFQLYGGSIIAALIAPYLSGKFDLHKLFIGGALLMCITFGIRLIDHDAHMALFIVCGFLGYFAYGILGVTLVPMLIDTATYGQYKCGIIATGVYLSSFPLLMKIGGGLGGSILGFWMDAAGYNQTLAVQPESALNCFFYGTILVDALGALIAALLLLFFYKLSKAKMAEIHQAMATHQEKAL